MDESIVIEFEVKGRCKNCGWNSSIYYLDKENRMYLIEGISDEIYDGICPNCRGELNMTVFEV